MKLGVRDGKIVWVKADCTVSMNPVSHRSILEFCGFPIPFGSVGSLTILAGDPLHQELIVIEAHGYSWGGSFILSKKTREYVQFRKADMPFAMKLVDNPPQDDCSLSDLIEQNRQKMRDAVDIDALAGERGLRVWTGYGCYWCQKSGEFDRLPDGWGFLEKGDAGLTRKVRRGPHWICMMKSGEHSVQIGTYAPEENIRKAYDELGGDEGAADRETSKSIGQEKREQQIENKLRAAILDRYPGIPPKDLEDIIKQSRSGGHVGTAQFLYFSKSELSRDTFGYAAYLAVQAHVRHNLTRYDDLIMSGRDRGEARREMRDEIDDVLSRWSRG